jgi:isoleucyl-tRNA synthetase
MDHSPSRLPNPRPRPVVHADHVTDEAGTGIVHMAPAHGQEDYHACHAQGIHLTPDQDLVDDLGRFRAAAGAQLAGGP